MSAVTPGMRAAGWNVLFTIGPEKDPCAFAGIYQVVGSNLVTFRDVCGELRLCFEFPNHVTRDESGNNDESSSNDDNPWGDIAFALADRPDLSLEMRGLSFVHGELLDKPVPSLPPIHPKQQDVLKYHIVSHKNCDILPSKPLSAHLKNGCAQHLPEPTRRYDPRYLMPNKGSSDSTIAGKMLLPRMLKATRCLDDNDIEGIDMLAPKNLEINEEAAKRTQSSFRHNCLLRGTFCAVSRQGESWCLATSVGPGIQACHIVPQIQYHLYPTGDDITTIDTSPRGLITAWEKTWSPNNGILLDKTLHELFNARLFSIHPTTFQIRTFVPYDKLIQYHGNRALVHPKTDIKALRHHYEMCCIENMAAEKPQLEEVPLPSTGTAPTRGENKLGMVMPSLPPTPGSEVGRTGDPSQERAPNPSQSQSKDAPGQDDLVEDAEAESGGYKRRRLECQVVDSQISPRPCYYSEDEDTLEGFITPCNSRDFLANVNWELRKFQALHRTN
ncbi:hypothetical protein O1611_g9951 [Lasiodiplodia mahajangana]|uniref:Uncharacterized protein n=1 Tax=Lasiodiplodia mahajangana TaxID=1108764 RepID=A0ACC2J3N8_9PEZI|nr:hypothetical protein O1611_g9951 [Lasiodiplodia mahajangana]